MKLHVNLIGLSYGKKHFFNICINHCILVSDGTVANENVRIECHKLSPNEWILNNPVGRCLWPLRISRIFWTPMIFYFLFHQGKKKAKEKFHSALPTPNKIPALPLLAFEKTRRNPNIAGRRPTGCLTTEFKNVSNHPAMIKLYPRTFLNEGGVSGWSARRCCGFQEFTQQPWFFCFSYVRQINHWILEVGMRDDFVSSSS